MKRESPEIIAARNLARDINAKLQQSPAFKQLPQATQQALLRDLGTIRQAFGATASAAKRDPYALTLETPEDFARRRNQARFGVQEQEPANDEAGPENSSNGAAPGPKKSATETLAARAGALIDEIDFPAFVAGLVHGAFDAIVDSTIRQMEAFADLVSAVAKNADDFTRDNVSANQARDWLVQQHPQDLQLDFSGAPRLLPQPRAPESEDEPYSPDWLVDYDLDGEELTAELIEEKLVPMARQRVGENRLHMLATMVLMGMNRIVVRDGSISARVRFRAAAADKALVDYAVSQDSGGSASWGQRGSTTYPQHAMMVSTVGVNVQADSDLKAELFGEVKINFVSETVPLDRFVDQARLTLLQRNARTAAKTNGGAQSANAAASPAAPTPAPAVATTPAVS